MDRRISAAGDDIGYGGNFFAFRGSGFGRESVSLWAQLHRQRARWRGGYGEPGGFRERKRPGEIAAENRGDESRSCETARTARCKRSSPVRIHCRNRIGRFTICLRRQPGCAKARIADPTNSRRGRVDAAALRHSRTAHGGDRSDSRFDFRSLRAVMNKAKKARIDQSLVERGFFASRERAQLAIMAEWAREAESRSLAKAVKTCIELRN